MENEHLLGSRGKRVLMRVYGFSALLLAACLTASAQSAIDYPYNPDFENDGFVGIDEAPNFNLKKEKVNRDLLSTGLSLRFWNIRI